MESCMTKPEVKKKTRPSKLPPWPPEPQKTNEDPSDKPVPVRPPRPQDKELSQTQYRQKESAINSEAKQNLTQSKTKEKNPELPVLPPRRMEQERNRPTRHSLHESDFKKISDASVQSEGPNTDIKEIRSLFATTKSEKRQKIKQSSFISHVTDTQDRGDDAADKQASASKPKALKGVMKYLKPTAKGGGGGGGGEALPDPDKDEAASEKERTAGDKTKREKSGEPKQDLGGRLVEMFRRPPVVTMGKADDDSEDNDEDQKTSSAGKTVNKKFKKKAGEAKSDQELSDSGDDLSLKPSPEEKGGFFSNILRKPAKNRKEVPPEQENLSAQKELSASNDSLSEVAKTKEKGSAFSGMFKKSSKPIDASNTEDVGKQPQDDERSVGSDGPSEENVKEIGLFAGFFKKAAKALQPEQDDNLDKKSSASSESLSETKSEKERGRFGVFLKKTPKGEKSDSSSDDEDERAEPTTAVGDDANEKHATKDKNLFSNMFKKPTEGDKETEVKSETANLGSSENLSENVPKGKKGGLAGIFKRSQSNDNEMDEEKGGLFSGLKKTTTKASTDDDATGDKEKSSSIENLSEKPNNSKEKSIFTGMFKKAPKVADDVAADEDKKLLSASTENLTEENAPKGKTGVLAGMFKKSPKPAPRSLANKDPLSDAKDEESAKDDLSGDELSGDAVNLEAMKEKKGGLAGIFKRTPKTSDKQDVDDNDDAPPTTGGGLRRRKTIKKKKRVVSFRIKTTLPKMPKLNAREKMPLIEENVEMAEIAPPQENTVEIQPVEMAEYPTNGNPLESEEENDGLLDWWQNVESWADWNETAHLGEEEEGVAMEEAADRVYMAARLFVHLFNQRGASLQHCILELLTIADAADQFHKKTVSAAVGGGVASVAGSLTTITGLILAPFTFGASIIVTAVGIGVATAGSIASATANITDTVHSNMDRKKVEKMIQDYQERIKDIRDCMDFVQEGIDTLQEWDFEKYSQSAAKKALNHNIKHVVKEGGRAGKALMINTDKLISTVQVLGAGAGAAKAAQAISVTTGVMSALFLALDVFFLAKDSHELRKGAKTKFASKIRDVCKDLQDGLLELNKVKTQLQKTMDGIEVEEYEEIQEVEVEVDDDLESDPKKLAELEQELDLMEEKLDKRMEEGKNAEKESVSRKKDKLEKETENQTAAWKEKREKEETSSLQKEKREKEKTPSLHKEKLEKEETSSLHKEKREKEKTPSLQKEKREKEKTPSLQKETREKEETSSLHKEKPKEMDDPGKEPNRRTGGSRKKSEYEKAPEEAPGKTRDSLRKPEPQRSRREDEERARNIEDSRRKSGLERSPQEEKPTYGNPERKASIGNRRRGSSSSSKNESGSTDKIRPKDPSGMETGNTTWYKPTVRDAHGQSDDRRASQRSLESSRRNRTEDDDAGVLVRGQEEGLSPMESARRKFERAPEDADHRRGSESDGKVKAGSQRERKASDRERKHGRGSSRHRSSILMDDGLYI